MGLVEEFPDRAIRPSAQMRLFQARDALPIIHEARRRDIKVLGIDGFIVLSDGVYPHLGDSIVTYNESDPWRAASEFLVEYRDTSLLFELSLDDEPE